MDVEDVDEVGLQFLQACVEGMLEGFLVVPDIVGLYDVVEALVGLVPSREFGSDDHLVSKTLRFGGEPLADPELRLLGLVIARCIDEVAALAVEVIEDSEDVGFRHGAHHVGPTDGHLEHEEDSEQDQLKSRVSDVPFITKVHCAQA